MSAARSRSGYTPASGDLAGRRFPSKQAYRNTLAQLKGYANDYQLRQARHRLNTAPALQRLSPEEAAARDRSLEALRLMRNENVPLRVAAERVGTTPRTVHKYAGPALRKEGGRYRAAPRDHLLRPLAFLTPEGNKTVWVRSSRDASRIARYYDAVRLYSQTGDDSRLVAYAGMSVTDADGRAWPFITDRKLLKRLGNAGVVSFESIYRDAA